MKKRKPKRQEHLSTLEEVRASTAGTRTMLIDPGSSGTGWAIFDMPKARPEVAPPPVMADGINSRTSTWIMRMAQIAEDIPVFCRRYRVIFIVLEWPELWAGSEKSHASAASGKLLQLVAACGAIIEAVHLKAEDLLVTNILLMVPREWKGQLKKPVVDDRIARAIGLKYPNHVSDTVGMGLAVMGLL
jgi:hypothetical protein